jgi:hypothetical protein
MKFKFTETTVSAGVLPQAFSESGEKKVEASTEKVEARINMSADVAGKGLCPECQKPMERSHANGIPVMTCDVHRIAIPIQDDAPTESTHG